MTSSPGSSSSASAPSSAPHAALDSTLASWLIPLTRRLRSRSLRRGLRADPAPRLGRRLVGYLSAIGIGVAVYGLILTLTGMDPFGATSTLPSARAWAEGLGLLVWMIGLWLVAARYAFKAIRPIKPNPAAITYRPMAAAAI